MNDSPDDEHLYDGIEFVAPHRRDEILRRIRVIRRYLSEPTRALALASAEELGVHVVTFYNLARAWKESHRADQLSGSRRPPRRRDHLSSAQHGVINQAVLDRPGERLERIYECAVEIGTDRGVALPAVATMRKYIRLALAGRLPPGSHADGADIVVDHCAVDIAVEGPTGRPCMPVAALVMAVPGARVLGSALSLDAPDVGATAEALARAFDRLAEAKGRSRKGDIVVALETFGGDEWERLAATLKTDGVVVRIRRRQRIGDAMTTSGLIGRERAGIRIRPRLAKLPFHERTATLAAGASPLNIAEAAEMLSSRWEPDAAPTLHAGPGAEELHRLGRKLHEVAASLGFSGG